MHTQSFTIPQFLKIGLTLSKKNVPSGVANCRNVPFWWACEARLTGALSKGGKMRGVATNVYLWKTSEKPKETGRNENSKFGSCIYV